MLIHNYPQELTKTYSKGREKKKEIKKWQVRKMRKWEKKEREKGTRICMPNDTPNEKNIFSSKNKKRKCKWCEGVSVSGEANSAPSSKVSEDPQDAATPGALSLKNAEWEKRVSLAAPVNQEGTQYKSRKLIYISIRGHE